MDHKEEKIEALFQLILTLDNMEDCRALFDDLCTRKELEKMAERIFAAKLLLQGKTYNQVISQAELRTSMPVSLLEGSKYGS